jgi:hypothetical protein
VPLCICIYFHIKIGLLACSSKKEKGRSSPTCCRELSSNGQTSFASLNIPDDNAKFCISLLVMEINAVLTFKKNLC